MGNVYSLTYHKITRLLYDPKASIFDLAAVVLQDRFLTARLLRLANSDYYGFPERIESVTGAIIVLGFDLVVAVAYDQYSQDRSSGLACEHG